MTDTAPPPAGWYPDSQGTTRWWDGQQWTEQTQTPASPPTAPQRTGLGSKIADAGRNLVTRTDPAARADVLWSAVGKPITQIGGGRYTLTPEYLHFESGTLRTNAQQIRTHEIHDVDAKQSMAQKARGLGTITLWAERSGGGEQVRLEDIPNFREGVNAINDAAFKAREGLRVREQTSHVNYQGTPFPAASPANPVTAAAPAAPASTASDLNGELERLAGFHQAGILTDEEFTAAKRKLLGL
ncbi:putative oligomerization/nucleic acid binding protein [Curtobacterium flaccumfaciens]|uniref:Putative oligomerization/nucleic acid binding protein n=1 Tax=Curtobacterium flaccumfaciens TaxID=2035 RepID=A0A4R6DDA5_9MICO|nr:DUF2510 domain-containing protein [Curtobacterium flaccumfaciens]TDN42545.1 putative oligomerization/nucleic acid binding protein [Curtobacterium flaccumfaciens]